MYGPLYSNLVYEFRQMLSAPLTANLFNLLSEVIFDGVLVDIRFVKLFRKISASGSVRGGHPA